MEPRQLHQVHVRVGAGQEAPELAVRQRADIDAKARLRIPDPLPQDRVDPQLVVLPAAAEARQRIDIHLEPLTLKLDDLHRHAEVILEDPFERRRRARPLREQAGVIQQDLRVDVEALAESARSQTDQAVEIV